MRTAQRMAQRTAQAVLLSHRGLYAPAHARAREGDAEAFNPESLESGSRSVVVPAAGARLAGLQRACATRVREGTRSVTERQGVHSFTRPAAGELSGPTRARARTRETFTRLVTLGWAGDFPPTASPTRLTRTDLPYRPVGEAVVTGSWRRRPRDRAGRTGVGHRRTDDHGFVRGCPTSVRCCSCTSLDRVRKLSDRNAPVSPGPRALLGRSSTAGRKSSRKSSRYPSP